MLNSGKRSICFAFFSQKPCKSHPNHAETMRSVLSPFCTPPSDRKSQICANPPSYHEDSGETAEDIARKQDVILSSFRQSYGFHHQCMRHTESSGHTSVIARDANTSLVTQSSRSKECKTRSGLSLGLSKTRISIAFARGV